MSPQAPYAIEILDAALDVVECLNDESGPLGAGHIARKLSLNRTRVFRILKTLEARAYVEQEPTTQTYRLGLKFFTIGEVVRERLDLRSDAAPILIELARHTGDSAHLLIRRGQRAITIDRRQGANRLQVSSPIGQSLPLYIGASPKILLAFMPQDDRERIIRSLRFESFTENTIKTAHQLRRCLEEIRQQGFAVDEQDYERGVYAIGAPVRDATGQVVAGITITTPETRYSSRRRRELTRLVVDAAGRLSERLGYTPETTHAARSARQPTHSVSKQRS